VSELNMTPKRIIKLLEKEGFVFARQSGSHAVYRKKGKRAIVPIHTKDIPKGTLSGILKDAGIKL